MGFGYDPYIGTLPLRKATTEQYYALGPRKTLRSQETSKEYQEKKYFNYPYP